MLEAKGRQEGTQGNEAWLLVIVAEQCGAGEQPVCTSRYLCGLNESPGGGFEQGEREQHRGQWRQCRFLMALCEGELCHTSPLWVPLVACMFLLAEGGGGSEVVLLLSPLLQHHKYPCLRTNCWRVTESSGSAAAPVAAISISQR